MRRRVVLLISGISLLTCLALVRQSFRSETWHGHLTVRHETADGDAHTRRWWQADFGRTVTFTSTWYYENHLLPSQIAVLKEEIARWPRVEWEEWEQGAYQWWYPQREIGPFRQESASGSIESGLSVRYPVLIALFAVLPGLLFLRGAERAITQIRSRHRPLGPPRPAGRKAAIAAAASLFPLLILSLAWLESEVAGIEARRGWVITVGNDGTHCGIAQMVSLRGGLHASYATGGRELQSEGSPDDPLLPPWLGHDYFHWYASADDVGLESNTLVHSIYEFSPLGPPQAQWHGGSEFRIGSLIDDQRRWVEVFISYWIPWLLCVPLPLYWLARRRGWIGRRAAGLCAACGYDLRASPTRCPECGMGVGTHGKPALKESGIEGVAPAVPS